MITLTVGYDDDVVTWYFVVKVGGETVQFTPGFRSEDEAREQGDRWIDENLK